MRNSVAKKIRKSIREEVGNLPEILYDTKSHSKLVETGELSPTTGLPVKRRYTASQKILGACQRSIYQQAKYSYKRGALHG